jgi:hypothetical protein
MAGKRMKKLQAAFPQTVLKLDEAIKLIKGNANAKFEIGRAHV